MATQFIQCRDVEHAVECLKAGLLWVNAMPKSLEVDYEACDWNVGDLYRRWDMVDVWMRRDFAILVED